MNKLFKLLGFSLAIMLFPLLVQAKPSIPFNEMELSEPVALVMLTIIVLLLCVIAVLASAVKILPFKTRNKNTNSIQKTTLVLLFIGLGMSASFSSFAQDAVAAPTSTLIGGLSKTSFYLLFSIIILELIAIFAMLFAMRSIINPLGKMEVKTEAEIKEEKEKKAVKKYAWFEKLNNTKSLDSESEAAISLGHDYDGIGELDNPTPPWWQWGFRLSIIFAFVYMWVYFVGKKAPLQLEELAIANERAAVAKEAYLANSANRVDENNVKLLTEEVDLTAGQALYLTNCAACHLDDGGGSIGPNLTDNYSIHGNHVNEIFKTIKYGVQGTGMKSWENDFSAKQIEQITSFVHSFIGTVPIEGKEAQGDLQETVTTNN